MYRNAFLGVYPVFLFLTRGLVTREVDAAPPITAEETMEPTAGSYTGAAP